MSIAVRVWTEGSSSCSLSLTVIHGECLHRMWEQGRHGVVLLTSIPWQLLGFKAFLDRRLFYCLGAQQSPKNVPSVRMSILGFGPIYALTFRQPTACGCVGRSQVALPGVAWELLCCRKLLGSLYSNHGKRVWVLSLGRATSEAGDCQSSEQQVWASGHNVNSLPTRKRVLSLWTQLTELCKGGWEGGGSWWI